MGHGAGTKLHIMPWEVAQCAAGEMKESERTGSLWWDARFLNNSSSSPEKIASEWRFEGRGVRQVEYPPVQEPRAYLPPSREEQKSASNHLGDTEAKVSG